MPQKDYPMYEKLKSKYGKTRAAKIANSAGKPVPKPKKPKKYKKK